MPRLVMRFNRRPDRGQPSTDTLDPKTRIDNRDHPFCTCSLRRQEISSGRIVGFGFKG